MANILLSHPAFALEDYQDISDFLSELNSTIDIARRDGDRIYGNAKVSEVETNFGFPLHQLAWENLNTIKEHIPSFNNDSQKILLKLLSILATHD